MEKNSVNLMKMLLLYITLFCCAHAIPACEYGEAVCEWKSTRIKWSCPAGENLVARAFWGREPGDNKTCVDGVSQQYLHNLNCAGSDDKALAAVSEWCNSNVDKDGDCKIRATVRKLRIGGKKYDPCRGTFKYLKVCSACVHDCDYGGWSDWSSCSETCAGGKQTRTRKGRNDPGCDLQETRGCNKEDCPACEYDSKIYAEGDLIPHENDCLTCSCARNGINCTKSPAIAGGWSEWNEQNSCSTTCDEGVRLYKRKCNNPVPLCGGHCEPRNFDIKREECHLGPCQAEHKECLNDPKGYGYQGTMAHTASGKSCGKWIRNGYDYLDFFGYEYAYGANNHCRNVPFAKYSSEKPFCMSVEDGSAEDCDIKLCEKYNCETKNPCTQSNIEAGRYYHPHDDFNSFIYCDEFSGCTNKSCPVNEDGRRLSWKQKDLSCLLYPDQYMPEAYIYDYDEWNDY